MANVGIKNKTNIVYMHGLLMKQVHVKFYWSYVNMKCSFCDYIVYTTQCIAAVLELLKYM